MVTAADAETAVCAACLCRMSIPQVHTHVYAHVYTTCLYHMSIPHVYTTCLCRMSMPHVHTHVYAHVYTACLHACPYTCLHACLHTAQTRFCRSHHCTRRCRRQRYQRWIRPSRRHSCRRTSRLASFARGHTAVRVCVHAHSHRGGPVPRHHLGKLSSGGLSEGVTGHTSATHTSHAVGDGRCRCRQRRPM